MQHMKRWFPLVLLTFMLLLFTACGESLQKPTGLEDDSSSHELVGKEENTSYANEDDDESEEDADESDEAVDEDKSEADEEEEDKSSISKDGDKSSTKKETTTKLSAKDENQTSTKSTGSSSSNEKVTSKQSSKSSTKSSDKKSNTTKSSSNSKEKAKNSSTSKSSAGSSSQKESKKEPAPPKKDTVTVSIVISSSEVPLSATSVEINDGEKVLDAFYRITDAKGIQRSVRGGGSGAYIEGIANVYEFDRGQGSGWMYRINGVFPDRGVGAVPIQNGDRIEFLYTTDLGKDLNANLQPYRR